MTNNDIKVFLDRYYDKKKFPNVFPLSRDRVMLEWVNEKRDRSLELVFMGEGRISYLKWDENHGVLEEGELSIGCVKMISSLLQWITNDPES